MKQVNPDFEKRGGLVVAIVQDAITSAVLMQGYMNKAAWRKTKKTGTVWFWSTSRAELWHKGSKSGNFFRVKELYLDCDRDCVLAVVEVQGDGKACHTGKASCFFNQIECR